MTGDGRDLTDAGKDICHALGTLLVNSVSSQLDYEPVDEEVAEESVRDTIEEHGFTPVSEGLGRAVYRVPSIYHACDDPLVVKFARPAAGVDDSRRGIVQNRTEAHIASLSADTEHEEWFAPLVHADPDERCAVMVECDTEAADGDDFAAVRDGLADAPWKPELDEEEVGLTPDGTPVAVDYGIVNDRW